MPTATPSATWIPSAPARRWDKAGHTLLDAAGLIPGFGMLFDTMNAIWYVAERDWTNAGLSAVAFVPIVGDVAGGAKLGIKAVKAADELVDVAKGTEKITADAIEGAGKAARMTTKQATEVAKELGFEKTSYLSHGQPVFKKGNTYITPDVDGHSGGVWKAAGSVQDLGSKSTRWGTYDANLNRIGD